MSALALVPAARGRDPRRSRSRRCHGRVHHHLRNAIADDAGLASGLVNTSVQVGGAIGLAVLATVSAECTHALLADGALSGSALSSGYHLAYVVAAGLVLAAIALAVGVLRSDTPATNEHTDPTSRYQRVTPAIAPAANEAR
jgi:hypothetical protein